MTISQAVQTRPTPRIAVLVASRNRPDLVQMQASNLAQCIDVPYDLYVVECGSDRDKVCEHSTLLFEDDDFKGKCHGHNLILEQAKEKGPYEYYWVLMNDVLFDPNQRPASTLIQTMEQNPQMAILSPTNVEGGYPGAAPQQQGGWRAVTTCDYLGFLIRADAVEQVGFLNGNFRYCWGAIHELAFKLYKKGWFVAYSDDVSYRHLGGSTYGQPNTKTISREQYQIEAKRFATAYMLANYGINWDKDFYAATQGHAIAVDTFSQHRQYWETAFAPEELQVFHDAAQAMDPPQAIPAPSTGSTVAPTQPSAQTAPVRLHLGAGDKKREGWLNIDIDPDTNPDIVSDVVHLASFADGSVDEIEANHLFEHLHYSQAHAALKEWRRILKPGGRLCLEMSNLDACIAMLGKNLDAHGIDLGMIGMYGLPPDIDSGGVPQMHKWGWSPTTLGKALHDAGFTQVQQVPIQQTWRPAAKYDRDMRLEAIAGTATAPRIEPEVLAVESFATPPAPESIENTVQSWDIEGTLSTLNVLLWPDLNNPDDLPMLLQVVGPRFASLDATLVLRVDPQSDVGMETARRIATHAPNVKWAFLTGHVPSAELSAIGNKIDGVIALPSTSDPIRAEFLVSLDAPLLEMLPRETDVGAAPESEPVSPTMAPPGEQTEPPTSTIPSVGPDPRPLSTQKPDHATDSEAAVFQEAGNVPRDIRRILAWPDYSKDSDLDALFTTVAPGFIGNDCEICLLFDPEWDGDLEVAKSNLEAAGERWPVDGQLNVMFLTGEVSAASVAQMDPPIEAIAHLPSGHGSGRSSVLGTFGLPVSTKQPTSTPFQKPSLRAQIDALNP